MNKTENVTTKQPTNIMLETKIDALIVALNANTAALQNLALPKHQEELPLNEVSKNDTVVDTEAEDKAAKKAEAAEKRKAAKAAKEAKEAEAEAEAEAEKENADVDVEGDAPTHESVRAFVKGKIKNAEVTDRKKIKVAFQQLVKAFEVEKLTDLDAAQTAELFEQVQDL